MGVRPIGISKYCIAVALLHRTLPANKWNRTLRTHFGGRVSSSPPSTPSHPRHGGPVGGPGDRILVHPEQEEGQVVAQVPAAVERPGSGDQLGGDLVDRRTCPARRGASPRGRSAENRSVASRASTRPSVNMHRRSPGPRKTRVSERSGSSMSPSAVPSSPIGSTAPEPRSTSGGWWPARLTVSSRPASCGRAIAYTRVSAARRPWPPRAGEFSSRRVRLGRCFAFARVRSVYRASAVTAAASAPLPLTSPRTSPQTLSPSVKTSKKSPPISRPSPAGSYLLATSAAGIEAARREPGSPGARRRPGSARPGSPGGALGEHPFGDVPEDHQLARRPAVPVGERLSSDVELVVPERQLAAPGRSGGARRLPRLAAGAGRPVASRSARAWCLQHPGAGGVHLHHPAEGVQHEHGVGHRVHDDAAGQRGQVAAAVPGRRPTPGPHP